MNSIGECVVIMADPQRRMEPSAVEFVRPCLPSKTLCSGSHRGGARV